MSTELLENLSIEELEALSKAAKEKAVADRAAYYDQGVAELQAIATRMGVTIKVVKGGEKIKKEKRPFKYVNPANPKQGWSGHGITPGWLKALLVDGKTLADFSV